MKILKITQDGAGVISLPEDKGDGFYTEDVESCIVYAFYGENALCVIHDTGQLSIPSIRITAAACGTINKVYTAQNSQMGTMWQNRAHRERKKKILSLLKCADKEQHIDIQQGAITFTRDGVASPVPMGIGEFEPVPDRVIRHHINGVNNLFSERNSQSIPVDVQYVHGGYTPFPKLLKAAAATRDRAQIEARRGDLDCSGFLTSAEQLGIV